MKLIHSILLIVFVFTISLREVKGQPTNDECSTVSNLCSGKVNLGTNIGATNLTAVPAASLCFEVQNPVWYGFVTNNIGGSAQVLINNVICQSELNKGTELEAILIQATDLCDPISYTAVSGCKRSATNFSIDATGLSPNTQYYVLVDGAMLGTQTLPAECDFVIAIQGEAVDIRVDAGSDIVLLKEESIDLSGNATGTFSWTPFLAISDTTSLTPTVNPENTTTYQLTASNSAGCSSSDQVKVTVLEGVSPYSAFSPNNDGINETWKIDNIHNFPNAKITIYTRWGQELYTTVGYTSAKEWSGTYKGTLLATGVYYYVIDLNEGNGKKDLVSGYVTIIY